MWKTLILTGLVCILAAIVGGPTKAFEVELPKITSKKTRVILAIFGLMLFIGGYIGYNSKKNGKLIVTVHKIIGVKESIFGKDGEVVLIHQDSSRVKAPVNKNGEAIFSNLTIGDSVKLAFESSEPFYSIVPDSQYLITEEGRLTLKIALPYLDRIHGRVLFGNTPLRCVLVKIDSLKTVTDSTGDYELYIPKSFQDTSYDVWFSKDKYGVRYLKAKPETGQPLNVQWKM
jgi:hypothetical protein